VLLHWVNTQGSQELPEALLVSRLGELADGALLCALASRATGLSRAASGAQIGPAKEHRQGIWHLRLATELVAKFDGNVRRMLERSGNVMQMIEIEFDGDVNRLAEVLLRSLHKKSLQQLRENPPRVVAKETRRKRTRSYSPPAPFKNRPLNLKVVKPKQKLKTKDIPMKLVKKFVKKDADMLLRQLQSFVSTSKNLPKGAKVLLNWLMHVSLLPRTLKRFGRLGINVYLLEGQGMDLLAGAFGNGVLLCEIVRLLEDELGNSRTNCKIVEAIVPNGKKLIYAGVKLDAVTQGARIKNISVALSILRQHAKMNPRRLFCVEDLAALDPPATMIDLLHDIRELYGSKVQKPKICKKNNRNPMEMRPPPPQQREAVHSNSQRKRRSFSLESAPRKRDIEKIVLRPSSAEISRRRNAVMKSAVTKVDDEEILSLKAWINGLGFSIEEALSLLEDPVCNGVFFWKFFSKLNGTVHQLLSDNCKHLHSRPISVQEMTENVLCSFTAMHTALGRLGSKLVGSKAILRELVSNGVDDFVKGNRQRFWVLMKYLHDSFAIPHEGEYAAFPLATRESCEMSTSDRLKVAYEESKKEIKRKPRKSSSSPQYSEQQFNLLEASVIDWLFSMQLECLPEDGDRPKSLLGPPKLREVCVNGVMLAEVYEAISKAEEGRKILGLARNARTKELQRQNICKVLEAIRTLPKMRTEFLSNPAKIQNGDRNFLLCLLEDIRRSHDGVPRFEKGKPYLGKQQPKEEQGPAKTETLKTRVSVRRDSSVDIWPTAFSASSVPKRRREISFSNEIIPRPRTACSLTYAPLLIEDEEVKEEDSVISSSSSCRLVNPSETQTTLNHIKTTETVLQWLRDELRIPVREPERLFDIKGFAPEFNDGTLFCLLVEKVEHIRGSLPGMQMRPKTTAACIHNFRIGLQVLQQNKRMPTKYLWSERDLAKGQVNVLVPLLAQMKACVSL